MAALGLTSGEETEFTISWLDVEESQAIWDEAGIPEDPPYWELRPWEDPDADEPTSGPVSEIDRRAPPGGGRVCFPCRVALARAATARCQQRNAANPQPPRVGHYISVEIRRATVKRALLNRLLLPPA